MTSKSNLLQITDFNKITSKEELLSALKQKNIAVEKVQYNIEYEEELKRLQIELVKLQQWVSKNKKRVVKYL